jgi:hypothetical protein
MILAFVGWFDALSSASCTEKLKYSSMNIFLGFGAFLPYEVLKSMIDKCLSRQVTGKSDYDKLLFDQVYEVLT